MTTAILLDKDYSPMLISPPFLPKRDDKESDEAYVRRSMTGDAPGAGAFPVSYQSRWHGGLHLTPPFEHNVDLEIRAIADGVLVHRGDISTKSDDPNHPLNYAGGWTSDGCIVLKHSTEIGEGENGKVEFYSIYHHLRHMPPAILAMKIGDKVWRKDPIGSAGYINDKPYLFHFEIIADDANARKLMGRIQGDVPLSDDGRKDVCYGDLHFYLPASTTFSDFPTNPHGVRPTPRDVAGPGVALFVSMHFENGHCTMTTYREDGTLVGTTKDDELPGAAYEYQLYETATKLYPQQPAAGFELLRFGRVLGTADTLIPANAPHWRKVALPSAKLWVNLNGAGVVKLSDADFPHWLGWRMVDASDGDLRCKDEKTLALLAPEAPTVETNQVSDGAKIEANAQIVSSEVLRKQRLARTAAKFVTDWDYTTFERRLGWLKNPEPDGLGMNDTSFARLQKHSQAVSFWTQAKLGMDSTPWHFEPREFIIHFKKCGWLSKSELLQLIPVNVIRQQGTKRIWEQPMTGAASRLLDGNKVELNRTLRKYLILSPHRQAAFFGNAAQETGWFGSLVEGGTPAVHHGWHGRGFLQLTNPFGDLNNGNNNYFNYWRFRGRVPSSTNIGWRESLSTNPDDATQSAGAYWVWPQPLPSPHAHEAAPFFADQNAPNIRTVVATNRGPRVCYTNESFRKVSACVNRPGSVYGSNPNFNGMSDRYSTFSNAQVVLCDAPNFPNASGQGCLFPEEFERRR